MDVIGDEKLHVRSSPLPFLLTDVFAAALPPVRSILSGVKPPCRARCRHESRCLGSDEKVSENFNLPLTVLKNIVLCSGFLNRVYTTAPFSNTRIKSA